MQNDLLPHQQLEGAQKSAKVSPNYKSVFTQTIYSVMAALPLFISGCTLGFSAISLPYMKQPNDVLHITEDEASWIASLGTLATPFGCLLSGFFMDRYGRQKSFILLNLPSLVGWSLISFNPTITRVYIGRILTGFSVGLVSTLPSVYISEMASSNLRGFLCNMGSVGISFGVCFVYSSSLLLKENWPFISFMCGLGSCLVAVMMCLLPESASWLMARDRKKKAVKSLMRFRCVESKADIEKELEETNRGNANRKSFSFLTAMAAMKRPESYKPVIIMNLFFLFQQISGTFVVIFYAVDFVKETGTSVDPFLAANFLALARFIFTLVSGLLSNKFGRRVCTIISGCGMVFSLGIVSIYLLSTDSPAYDHTFENTTLYNTPTANDTTVSQILPVVCLIFYIVMSTIGFLSVPWGMMSEMYVLEIRSLAAGLSTFTVFLTSFVMLKLYPSMLETFNKHGTFFFYTASAAVGTLIMYFCLPETQGRTLQQVTEIFTSGTPARKTKVLRSKPRNEENGEIEGQKLLEKTLPVTVVRTNKTPDCDKNGPTSDLNN